MKRFLILLFCFPGAAQAAMNVMSFNHRHFDLVEGYTVSGGHRTPTDDCDSALDIRVAKDASGDIRIDLSPRFIFTWKTMSSTKIVDDPCTSIFSSTVDETKGILEDQDLTRCSSSDEDTSFRRRRLSLRAGEVTLTVSPLRQDGGKWVVDGRQPTYVCKWAAK
jgi:hypothetical protein